MNKLISCLHTWALAVEDMVNLLNSPNNAGGSKVENIFSATPIGIIFSPHGITLLVVRIGF